jgi:hypothetical protein
VKFNLFGKTRIYTAILFSLLAAIAHGATYYVSTSGSDSNSGAQSAPFRHISRGVSAAGAGDTVIVMDGTYDNEGQVAASSGGGSVVTMMNTGSSGHPITIMAQNRGGAILNAASGSQSELGCYGAWAYFDLSYTSYVVIQGFVIENGCVNAFHANGSAHDITIRWNEVRNIGNWNNPASTLSPTGIYLNQNEYNFTFDGNIWHDIGGGSNVNQQHAIYSGASNVTIVNNMFYNQVHGWDIQTAGGHGIYIANNTFAFPNPNRDGQIVIWDDYNAGSLSDLVIENNVFYQPSNYAIVSNLAGPIGGCTIQYNITTSGSMWDDGASCSMGNNMTNTDPMLVNPSGLDFHLKSGSPAIGSGMTVPYTTIDFTNSTRTGSYDRGAYAAQGSAAPPPVPTQPPAPTPTPTPTPPSVPVAPAPATVALTPFPSIAQVTAGGSIAVTVRADITGGANFQFAVSGLPSGVTGGFVLTNCSTSCLNQLVLNSDPSTPPQTGNLTITATAAGISASAPITLYVLAPGS